MGNLYVHFVAQSNPFERYGPPKKLGMTKTRMPPVVAAPLNGLALNDDAALRERLQTAGLRVTAVRLLVLKTLSGLNVAVSHADIEASLPRAVDRVTLYRTLESFVFAGRAQGRVSPERITRFALTDGVVHTNHAHFECDDCGHVYCLPVKPPRRAQMSAGFDTAGAALHFHGHNPACTRPKVAPERPSNGGMNGR